MSPTLLLPAYLITPICHVNGKPPIGQTDMTISTDQLAWFHERALTDPRISR